MMKSRFLSSDITLGSIICRFTHRPVTCILFLLISVLVFTVGVAAGLDPNADFIDIVQEAVAAIMGEIGRPESRSRVWGFLILMLLMLGITMLSVVTARLTTYFEDFSRKGGMLVKKSSAKNHVLICGWNFQGLNIVNELIRSGDKSRIVILCDLQEHPLSEHEKLQPYVDWVKGDPTQDSDLRAAGADRADSIIVLTDFRKDGSGADAKAVLITLAVEELNRAVHTCVQVMNSNNIVHLRHAHADEIICLDHLGGNLAVASAKNHGISHVVRQLLSFNEGSELYRYEIKDSDELTGMEFSDLCIRCLKRKIMIIGVETDLTEELVQAHPATCMDKIHENNRVILINPQEPYMLCHGDAVFLIARDRPESI